VVGVDVAVAGAVGVFVGVAVVLAEVSDATAGLGSELAVPLHADNSQTTIMHSARGRKSALSFNVGNFDISAFSSGATATLVLSLA